KEGTDVINFLVGIPHLKRDGGAKPVAVLHRLAVLRHMHLDAIGGKAVMHGIDVLLKHLIVIIGIVQRRDLRDADDAVETSKARACVTYLISTIPRPAPEAPAERNVGPIPAA